MYEYQGEGVSGTSLSMDFPGGSASKESACSVGYWSLIPGLGRYPGDGNGNPFQYSYLENSMDRSLAGYNPWGHNELDMTEQLTLSLFFIYLIVDEHTCKAAMKTQTENRLVDTVGEGEGGMN